MTKTCAFILAFCGSHLIFFPPAAHCLLTTQEEEMKRAVIPAGYKRFLAPCKKGDPAVVYVDLSSVDFDVITGGDTEFHLMAVLRLQWRDPRLNLTYFVQNSFLSFPRFLEDAIWKPTVSFLDTKAVGHVSNSVPGAVTKTAPGGYIAHSRKLHPDRQREPEPPPERKTREFQPGDLVYWRNFGPGPEWIAAKVAGRSGRVVYRVQIETGEVHRRHVDHLCKAWSEFTPPSATRVGIDFKLQQRSAGGP